jgi:hypothetical protein
VEPGWGSLHETIAMPMQEHARALQPGREDVTCVVWYVRFAPVGIARAVLTEDRPCRDLEALLLGEGISCVWRVGSLFQDNAQGCFT